MTTPSPAAEPYPPALRAWTLVAIFFLASIVSTIDRGILNLVVDPVRRDLMISDVQISLLQGLSFGLFYATVGVPLGLVADRVQRKWLIVFGVVVWSAATVMGGLAPNYGWMFVSRLLVGLGEATLGPCAISMIGDMFAPQRRGRPISVYLTGQAISGGLAILLVGFVLTKAPEGLFDFIPGTVGLAPWRVAFIVAGLLGIGLAILFLTQREPARRGVVIAGPRGLGVRPTVQFLVANRQVFLPFYLGFALFALASYGMVAWMAVVLMRQFAFSTGDVTRYLGGASVLAGLAGPLIAGAIVDLQARRGRLTAKLQMLVVLPLLALPATLAGFAPDGMSALVLLSVITLVFPMVGTSMLSAVPEMLPNNMRGVAVALFGLTNTLIGSTMGPLLIAWATQYLFKDPRMVGYSITVVAAPALLLSCLLYAMGLRALKASLARGDTLAKVMTIDAT